MNVSLAGYVTLNHCSLRETWLTSFASLGFQGTFSPLNLRSPSFPLLCFVAPFPLEKPIPTPIKLSNYILLELEKKKKEIRKNKYHKMWRADLIENPRVKVGGVIPLNRISPRSREGDSLIRSAICVATSLPVPILSTICFAHHDPRPWRSLFKLLTTGLGIYRSPLSEVPSQWLGALHTDKDPGGVCLVLAIILWPVRRYQYLVLTSTGNSREDWNT